MLSMRREGIFRPLCVSLGGHALLLGTLLVLPGSPGEQEVLMVDLALTGASRESAAVAGNRPDRGRYAASAPPTRQLSSWNPSPTTATDRQPARAEPSPAVPTVGATEVTSSLPRFGGETTVSIADGGGQGAPGPPSSGGTGAGSGTGTFSGRTVEGVFGATDGPAFSERVSPVYPRTAQRLGREGIVLLRLSIDARGTLTAVEVVERAGHGFDEAALAAVRESRFTPARRGGTEVPCRALLSIRFKLDR